MARPSKYREEYSEQVFKLCLLGASDEQIADFFNIATSTIYVWNKSEPAFLEAKKRGKLEADNKVAESLFNRALGYSHKEEKIFCTNGEVTKVDTVKKYPPDTVAAIFWLKNRNPEYWRDKQEIEHSGTIKNASELTDEDLFNIATTGSTRTTGQTDSTQKPDKIH